jgi:REP element-mobilizing transposase RayT
MHSFQYDPQKNALTGKHHRHSIRLQGYDYSQSGAYFVTICTYGKEHLFGQIVHGEMCLNEFGTIVEGEWITSARIREEISIGEYVIMPNHFHAIAIINDESMNDYYPKNVQQPPIIPSDNTPNGSAPRSISSLMAGFKSSVTKRINQLRKMPGIPVWQRSFHDHIIRDEEDYIRICNYIENNPLKWLDDDEYTL